ncbi:54S ribosomal protein L39, mitochondrial [Metarhizium anisopliae]
MAKKAKARLINVRLISMAMTGFFYTFKRPRTAPLMGMMKYDPIGTNTTLSHFDYLPSDRLRAIR